MSWPMNVKSFSIQLEAIFGMVLLLRYIYINVFMTFAIAKYYILDYQCSCYHLGSYRTYGHVWPRVTLLHCAMGIRYWIILACSILVTTQAIPGYSRSWSYQRAHDHCRIEHFARSSHFIYHCCLYPCDPVPMVSQTLSSPMVCQIQLSRLHSLGFSHFAHGVLCCIRIAWRCQWRCS